MKSIIKHSLGLLALATVFVSCDNATSIPADYASLSASRIHENINGYNSGEISQGKFEEFLESETKQLGAFIKQFRKDVQKTVDSVSGEECDFSEYIRQHEYSLEWELSLYNSQPVLVPSEWPTRVQSKIKTLKKDTVAFSQVSPINNAYTALILSGENLSSEHLKGTICSSRNDKCSILFELLDTAFLVELVGDVHDGWRPVKYIEYKRK